MPARWLQQKVLKQKRMRRAYLKKYSMKNTGPVKNAVAITLTKNADGEPIRSVTDVSIKGRSKAGKNFIDSYLLQRYKFDPNSSEALYVRTAGLHSDLTPGSKELVLAKLNQSRNNAGSLQGETQYVVHICHDRPTSHCRLYISREDCFFIEARITAQGPVILESIRYGTKERAKTAYIRGGILWDKINSSSQADSS